MNCLECQELLQSRLDGDNMADSPAQDRHLAGCPTCRRHHAAATLMLEGLKVLPPTPRLPGDFAERMTARVLRDRLQRRARMRRRMWATAGLAAAILIMVWAGNIWLPRNNVPNPPLAANPKPAPVDRGNSTSPQRQQGNSPPANESPPPKKPVEEDVVPLAKRMDEARGDVLAMTSRWADQTKEQALLFVPPMDLPAFPGEGRPPMEEPAAQSLRQAGQGVSEGLHTVSRNARRAVSFFMKELPVFDSAN